MIRWCCRCKIQLGAEQGRCPQCAGPLEAPPLPTDAPPIGLELELFESGSVDWIQSVSAGLRFAGIPHWVAYGGGEEVEPNRPRFGGSTAIDLLVPLRDVERAQLARDAVVRSAVPDVPAAGVRDGHTESCPACGFRPLPPEAGECPDCELVIPTHDPNA